MGKLTIDGLKEIKEKTAKVIAQREGKATCTITVHMGTCGIAAGARTVMNALLEARAAADRDDILIRPADCVGKCAHEPMITIETAGRESAVQYRQLDDQKARRIFKEHVLEGRIQQELLLPAD